MPLANGVVVVVVVMVVVAELELFSENVATHDVETAGVPGDARGTIRDAPVGAGEDESVLFSTRRDSPACTEGKLEVTTGEIMQLELVEDAEDDRFQLVLEVEANGAQ